MNITATKCKTARSWILDILTPPHEKAWLLSPTPLPELPKDITEKIEKAITEDFQRIKEEEAEAKAQAEQQMAQAQAGPHRQRPLPVSSRAANQPAH